MPSQQPPRDDGSSHRRPPGERRASEALRPERRRLPRLSGRPRQEDESGEPGIDQWATFRMPTVDDNRFANSFPFDVSGLPTMQLPALPKELFPAPIRQVSPRQQGVAERAGHAGQAPAIGRPPLEEREADGASGDVAIDDLPTWVLPAIPISAPTPTPATKRRRFGLGRGLDGYLALVGGLLKRSGVYALASMASPLIALILSPYVTHHISRAEYGALAVVATTISLTAGLSQLGLGSAFFRAYNYDYTTPHEHRSIIATAGTLLTLTSLPIATLVTLFAPIISGLLFNGDTSHSQLIVIGAGVLLLQNLTVTSFAFLRAENRAIFYALLSIGNLLVNMICTIIFVGPLNKGAPGSLFGTGCGYAFVFLCTVPFLLVRSRLHLRVDIARSMLAFGVPQVFSLVSFWVLQWSDRLLLGIMRSPSETATYAVAYNLGTVLSTMVISPFTLAWPTTMYSIAKREDGPRVFANVFRWFSLVLLFGAFGLSVVGRFVLDWLFPPSYHSVAYIIPIIATSIAFYGLYIFQMTGVSLKRKTWLSSLFMTIAAVLNFGCNLVLIPLYGASGAALSTLIAYGVLVVIAYFGNQRLYPVPYQMGALISVLIMGFGLYLISYGGASLWGISWQWPLALIALIIFGVWMVLSGRWINASTARAQRQGSRPAYSNSRRTS
jgi:O-antigen/teichoic acid export membrane protein